MATRTAQKRLTLEYKELVRNPTAYIEAHPNEENILQWYYIITGPPDTIYEGGQYMGTLTFPADYPFNPPAIRMLTPSGRFEPNARLCLSISDYHPKTWNPSWSVATILVGLLSFMTGNEQTAGSIATTDLAKKRLAAASREWNLKDARFRKQFPKLCETMQQENEAAAAAAASNTGKDVSAPRTESRDFKPPAWLYIAGITIVLGTLYKVL